MPAPDTNKKDEANAAKNTKKWNDTTEKRNGTPKHSQGPAHLGRDRARLGVPVDDALLPVLLRVPHQRACSQAPLVKGGGECASSRAARWTMRGRSAGEKSYSE